MVSDQSRSLLNEEVKVINGKEMTQSDRRSHSKNRGRKHPNDQPWFSVFKQLCVWISMQEFLTQWDKMIFTYIHSKNTKSLRRV